MYARKEKKGSSELRKSVFWPKKGRIRTRNIKQFNLALKNKLKWRFRVKICKGKYLELDTDYLKATKIPKGSSF